MDQYNCLDQVLTALEAAREWGLEDSTIRVRCNKGGFEPYEYRRATKEWLVLRSAMIRVYGEPKSIKMDTPD